MLGAPIVPKNKKGESVKAIYKKLVKKNEFSPIAKAFGFSEDYYAQISLQGISHLINWSDVEEVVKYLFDNGYDVIKIKK